MISKDIIKMFTSEIDSKKINEYSNIKLRNCEKGIKLMNIIYYSMMYTKKEFTKEFVVSTINNRTGSNFTRQAFDRKEKNIPIKGYENIFTNIIALHIYFPYVAFIK